MHPLTTTHLVVSAVSTRLRVISLDNRQYTIGMLAKFGDALVMFYITQAISSYFPITNKYKRNLANFDTQVNSFL